MKTIRRTALHSLFALGCLAAAPALSGDVHFALDRSAPEAEATVEAPDRVTLWFTQEPQEGSTAIRLIDGAEELVETGEVTQSADDPTSFFVDVPERLAAGSYTVAWRGMGADGHVVRDRFVFAVTAH